MRGMTVFLSPLRLSYVLNGPPVGCASVSLYIRGREDSPLLHVCVTAFFPYLAASLHGIVMRLGRRQRPRNHFFPRLPRHDVRGKREDAMEGLWLEVQHFFFFSRGGWLKKCCLCKLPHFFKLLSFSPLGLASAHISRGCQRKFSGCKDKLACVVHSCMYNSGKAGWREKRTWKKT